MNAQKISFQPAIPPARNFRKSEEFDPFGGFLGRVRCRILRCLEGRVVRRLYSTFATGWPGLGLLLMRFVVGSALILRARPAVWSSGPTYATVTTICLAGCGILVIAGLWTPVLCLFVSFGELWRCTFHLGDPSVAILMATISCALAMLGPGLWSIDARLFGWKRVELAPRKTDRHSP